jgi:probable blue pigment (indigoidine) exporter
VASQVEAVEGGAGVVRGGEAMAVALLAFTVVVWGCTPRVTAEAAPFSDPVMLTSLRAAPTAIALLIALPLLRYRLPSTRSEWAWASVSGLLMVTWFLFAFTESVIKIGPGIAIVLMSTSPFFIAIAGRVLFGRRITPVMLLGMLVGFAGVILVASTQIDASGDAGDMMIGMALAISAAIAWAAGTMIVSEQITRRPDTDLIGLTTGQYIVGGAVLLVLALLIEGPDAAQWSEGTLWLATAFIAIIGSAVATVTYFGSLRWLDPASVTTWLFLSPVVSVVLEIVLGNMPDVVVLLGMLVTIAGVAIVSAAPRFASRR